MGSSSPREARPAGASFRQAAPFLVTAGFIILLSFLLRLAYLERRGFNPDEFQHLHSAWCIAEGLVTYRDYYEHHTPWLHFSLAALLPFYDVELEPADAEAFIFLARRAMWVLTGGILVLVYFLARRALGMTAPFALLALVFLGNDLMFLAKTLEIRPDVPASLFFLASLLVLVGGLRKRPEARFAVSGLLLGSAVMFNQKVLFGFPGIAAALALYVFDGDVRRSRISQILFLGLGFLTPLLLTSAYYALQGGLGAFIEYNFLMNARWKAEFSPWPLFLELAQQNPFHFALGLVGIGMSCLELRRADTRARGEAFIVLPALSFLVGTFVVPVPFRQYALQFLPFLALYAAVVVEALLFPETRPRRESRRSPVVIASAIVVGAFLALAYPTFSSPIVFTLSWLVVAGAVSFILVRRRSRFVALTLLLVPLSVRPLLDSRVFWERRNWSTLQNLSWVLENVSPRETILDGFSGLGVFRPHAFFYYFLHGELLLMLEESDWRLLEEVLSDPKKAPKLVIDDRFVARAPRRVRALVDRDYASIGPSPIRARWDRSHWTDEGPRIVAPHVDDGAFDQLPYVVVEDGWSGPEEENGLSFRRSRGRRSRLVLPIAEPRDFELRLRARRLFEEPTLTFELAVNGAVVGESTLPAGWRDYRFTVPASMVREGFNEVLLTYSKTPRQADPASAGGNAVLALHSVELEARNEPP